MAKSLFAIALMMCLPAMAQMPSLQPQIVGMEKLVEFDIRLKTSSDGSGSASRLVSMTFGNLNARYFSVTIPCWNKTAVCPLISSATVQAFIKKADGTRQNVTKYSPQCAVIECIAPAFTPIQAKPGEAYFFSFDRDTAKWAEADGLGGARTRMPGIVKVATTPPPPAPAIAASPASVSFAFTRGGALPGAQTIKVTAPGNWSATDQSLFYDQNVACWAGGGGSCASGASTTLTPSAGMTALPLGVTSAPLTITSGTLKLIVPVTVTVQ